VRRCPFHSFNLVRLLDLLEAAALWADATADQELAAKANAARDAFRGVRGEIALVDAETQKELLRLTELQYDRSTRLTDALQTQLFTIRGWAITLWVGIAGFAVQQHRWDLAALDALVSCLFALVDAQHGVLSQRARDSAVEAEHITASYFTALTLGVDSPGARREFVEAVSSHQFGLYEQLAGFRMSDLLQVSLWSGLRTMYVILFGAALVLAVLLGLFH